jgi:hypothetical protein
LNCFLLLTAAFGSRSLLQNIIYDIQFFPLHVNASSFFFAPRRAEERSGEKVCIMKIIHLKSKKQKAINYSRTLPGMNAMIFHFSSEQLLIPPNQLAGRKTMGEKGRGGEMLKTRRMERRKLQLGNENT